MKNFKSSLRVVEKVSCKYESYNTNICSLTVFVPIYTRVLQTYDVRFLLIIFLFRVGTIIFQKMNTRFNGSFSIEKKEKRERERHSPREMDTISRGKTSRSYTFLPRARARRHQQLVANHHRLPFLLSIIGRKL